MTTATACRTKTLGYRCYLPNAAEVAHGHLPGHYYARPLGDKGLSPFVGPFATQGEATLWAIRRQADDRRSASVREAREARRHKPLLDFLADHHAAF